MSDQLKPCPFCGSSNIGSRYVETYSIDSSYDVFGCKDCHAGFVDGSSNDWNLRADDAALAAKDARIKQLEAEIETLREIGNV